MSIESITKGQLSASQKDGGVYSSRLSAFQENYVRPQFEVDTDAITQEMMKSENFAKAALGSKVTPSNAKMYESHYQLAKDKFDLLYSDETLNHFSKDEESMRKWSDLVDQLNQEISMYEQVYEDSYGDPSKADGKGVTFSDAEYRRRVTGGDSNRFWDALGFEDVTGVDPMETMKLIDSKQHSNLKLDFETGAWDYDSESKDLLELSDPQTASQLFSYELAPSKVLSAGEYAADKTFVTVYATGDDGFGSLLNRMRSDDTYVRSAISDYISENDIQDATVMDFMNGNVSPKYPPLDEIVSGFDDKVRSSSRALKAQKAQTVKTGSSKTPKDPLKDVLRSMADSNIEEIGEVKMFTISPVNVVDKDIESKVQNIAFDPNERGVFYAYYDKAITTESPESDTGFKTERSPGFHRVDSSSAIYGTIISAIKSKYGEDAFTKMELKAKDLQ